MELVKGQIVVSRAGRDVTRAYVVMDPCHKGDRVLLCDGDRRTLQNPKCKNRRHLAPAKTVLPPGGMDTDLMIKMALKQWRAGQQQEGG